MAKDTSPSGGAPRGNRRKPVTIDLPAEEVRAKDELAAESSDPAPAPDPTVTPLASTPAAEPASAEKPAEPSLTDVPSTVRAAETASSSTSAKSSTPRAAETAIPSAFAGGASSSGKASSSPTAAPSEPRKTSFAAPLIAAVLGGLIGALAVWLLAYGGLFSPPAEERPDFTADIEALRAEMAELEQAAPEADLAPLREEVAALQQTLASLSGGSTHAPDTAAIEELQTRLAALETGAQEQPASAASASDLSAVRRDVTDLRQRLGGLANAEAATEELKQALAEISARLDAAEAGVAENSARAGRAEKLGAAVAADALQAAIESGRPFAAELTALQTLGVDAEATGALQSHAETGLPTTAKLRADFEMAIAGIPLNTPVPEGAGVVDRLLESARGLVEVRPSGATEGADPAAIVARIRAALQVENLDAALAEWETLPPEIKAATEAWAQSAAARRDADALVARLRSDVLAALATEG